MWNNIYEVVRGIKFLGFSIPDRFSCIIPILIGDESKSIAAEKILLQEGIVCSSVRVPAVAPDKAQLRITINASHSAEHIDLLLKGLSRVASELEIPLLPINIEEWRSFASKHLPEYVAIKSL